MTDNSRGALLMAASMAAFTVNEACFKALLYDIPLSQGLLLRGLGTTAALFLMAHYMGALRVRLSRRDQVIVVLRSLTEIATVWLSMTALAHMALADVIAIKQSQPLVLILAAALFLAEPVGFRRFLALGVGFVGVMMIVRPGTEGFNIYSLYVVGSVFSLTLREILTRRLSRAVPSLTVAAVASLGITLFGMAGSATVEWQPVSGKTAMLILGATVAVLFAYVTAVMTMRNGDVSFIAPFRYTSLVWALLIGFFAFGDWPDAVMLIGATLVVGSGLYALWRESRPVAAAPGGVAR